MARDPNTRLAYSTGGETPPEPSKSGRSGARTGYAAKSAASPGIRLRLERRPSDRVVTSISGLPGLPADLAAFARALKSACGAGGTVKDGVIELQGDHRGTVEAFLAERGLKAKRAGG